MLNPVTIIHGERSWSYPLWDDNLFWSRRKYLGDEDAALDVYENMMTGGVQVEPRGIIAGFKYVQWTPQNAIGPRAIGALKLPINYR